MTITLLARTLCLCFLFWCLSGHHLLGQLSSDTEIQYLSGKGKDDPIEWDFFCSEGRNSQRWTKIGVPSCWELKGFGTYNYGHDPMEERGQEYGLYKRNFFVPKAWKRKEVKLVFEGVMTDCEVRINGNLAGAIHQGAFYEFSYSISDLLKFDKDNLLEVKVNKVSANESINYAERKADFWIFGGIYRPVYLKILPREHIERVAVDAQASGEIVADLFLQAPTAQMVSLQLQNLAGESLQTLTPTFVEQSSERWRIRTQASDIQTWNPEQPNLYQLAIELKDEQGAVLHHLTQRIGFRTVELREADGIYVNGQRIKFKGVNRHSFYPTSGRTTSKELSIWHVELIKGMNMNAVRMSHYPPDAHFLEVCDSLGLFVIDEVCTWHSPSLDTEVGRKIIKETVVRDVNHPSILLWANGNETGWNTELDDDYALWDIQRREVIHPWNVFRKTNTLHYMYYHGLARDVHPDKIFFPTEFLHGLYDGGHGAGLEDYWKLMWDMPLCAGGFLWDFADEAVVRTDQDGRLDTDGNHAADGILSPYGEKEASYYTIKEIWSPVYIEDRFIRPHFDGRFRVENRYHFTNLNECSLTAKWVKFNGPGGSSYPTYATLAEYALESPDLAPGEVGFFEVDKPENWLGADALYIRALDPDRKEIFTWTFPVKTPDLLNQGLVDYARKSPISSSRRDGTIEVEANGILFAFDEKSGLIQEVKKGEEIIPLHNGPIILGQSDPIDTVYVTESGEQVVITARFEETDKFKEWVTHQELSADLIEWTVYSNGLLDLRVEMKGKKKVKDYKGISFSFAESSVAGMRWLGDGPYRVWRNRRKGTQFGIWENDYNNTVTGESEFVYPEFKGFFSNLYWAKIQAKQTNGFTVYCHTPHTYLRMLTPQAPSEDPNHRVTVAFPAGDISFLKNIPPIGTKFQNPAWMGPQSNPENFFGNDDEPLVLELTFEF